MDFFPEYINLNILPIFMEFFHQILDWETWLWHNYKSNDPFWVLTRAEDLKHPKYSEYTNLKKMYKIGTLGMGCRIGIVSIALEFKRRHENTSSFLEFPGFHKSKASFLRK